MVSIRRLAERAVRSTKKVMEKSYRDRSDIFLDLLNLNVPRDTTLGSPAQRLMSRQTRTTLPVAKKLLEPHMCKTQEVHAQLLNRRCVMINRQPLQPLMEGQVVQLQTPGGYNRMGMVKEICQEPRSYIVQSEGRFYRRNRRHILPVDEPAPTQQNPFVITTAYPDAGMGSEDENVLMSDGQVTMDFEQSQVQVPVVKSPVKNTTQGSYRTRAGRVCKP